MEERKFSLINRFLHWAIAFALLFLLLTIFLRQNWMNKHHVADILTAKLAELDVALEDGQAVKIAKAIRKPMWDWHIYVGYVLIGLYFIKLLFMTIKGSVFLSPFAKASSAKDKFQSWMYILFYVLLGFSLVTGALIVLWSDMFKHALEDIHKLCDYWLLAFIVLHFGGILLGELGSQKGIVSRMINGKE